MKYIRTKDGHIYDTFNCVGKYYVVKEADTIEELCDEFVSTNTLVDSELLKKAINKEPTNKHKQGFSRFIKRLIKTTSQ